MIPTTAHFGPVPGWAILWAVFLTALGLFVRRVSYVVRLLLLGRPEMRWPPVPDRIKRVLVDVFGQGRMLDEPLVGIPHMLIFYGFLVFLLASSGMLFQGLLPSLHVPSTEENRIAAPVIAIFVVMVLIALTDVTMLVVACPKDYVMFTEALKTTGLEGRLQVKDLTELVAEAVTAGVGTVPQARVA